MTPAPPRILFYVQHLLGIGHLKRASLIARAIMDEGLACDMVLGGPETAGIDWSDATLHRLPELHAADSGFSNLATPDGGPPDGAYWDRRRDLLLQIARSTAPDLILIELYPFGRRAFRRELLSLLEHAASSRPRPLAMCSVRDILVDKGKADRARETVDVIERFFDEVLVHGDPAFVPLQASFPAATEISEKLVYTGYVAPSPPPPSAAGKDEVIVAAGGGAVGAKLLLTALAARPLTSLADRRWRILTGPNLDAEAVARLRDLADDLVTVEPNRADYPALLVNAAVSVSQGGYNTTMDLVRARCPAVVVPFAEGRESEQTQRTSELAKRGYLTLLDEADMTAERLARAIEDAHVAGRPGVPPLSLDGAAVTARHIAGRLGKRPVI